MSPRSLVTHRGGCHCGAVAFEVEAPRRVTASECNCSICRMSGYLHLIVPRSNPDGYSVNVRCLERSTLEHVEIRPFDDGERAAADAQLRDLSQA